MRSGGVLFVRAPAIENLVNAKALDRLYIKTWLRVVTAPGANEALEKLSTDRRIEILITDINMPGMDGYELARAAVRMRERLKVIVLSGREAEGCEFPLIRKLFLQQDLVETMRRTTGLC